MTKSELMEKIKDAQKNPGMVPGYYNRGRIVLEKAVGCKVRKNQLRYLEEEKLIYQDIDRFDWCVRQVKRLECWQDKREG